MATMRSVTTNFSEIFSTTEELKTKTGIADLADTSMDVGNYHRYSPILILEKHSGVLKIDAVSRHLQVAVAYGSKDMQP